MPENSPNINYNINNRRDKLIQSLLFVVSIITLIILAGIFFFLFYTGSQAFQEITLKEFLTGKVWNPTSYNSPKWGILGLFVSTVLITLCALIIAIPLGISGAIYLSEIAKPKVREILKPSIEMISSIPSVVLGLLGIIFLSPLIAKIFGLNSGFNILTSSIIIAIMILPTIISITEDILTSLPKDFREASLALGATKWQTIKKTLLPAAAPGIVAAIMLAFGRAVGETMAVLMVSGNSIAMPNSIFDSARPMTANIAIEIKEVVKGSLHYDALFAIAAILFIITFFVNLISDIIIEKYSEKYK